jgi:hypothetical protein
LEPRLPDDRRMLAVHPLRIRARPIGSIASYFRFCRTPVLRQAGQSAHSEAASLKFLPAQC